MLQTLRERLTLLLIVLLPFHALLVTLLTRLLVRPGHAPIAILAVWKEFLLGIVLLIALLEILRGRRITLDVIDALILGLFILGVLVSLPHFPLSTPQLVYGVRYDFIPLLAFLVLRRVPWSEKFERYVMPLLLIVGGIIAAYGFVTFFLPPSFFTALGYSDLHSTYLPDGPLAAFQQIGGTTIRRIQSTLSGPNQLGLWLLIPLASFLSMTRPRPYPFTSVWVYAMVGGIIGAALLLTFSRTAWIAAAVIFFVAIHRQFSPGQFRAVFYPFLVILCTITILGLSIVPGVITRLASTLDHIVRPMEAVRVIARNPWGLGLGAAGPAQNRVSDACIVLPPLSDVSWAKDRPNLCVFLGATQVQPLAHRCQCPFLPENWYLQMGVEMGVFGMVLFVMLMIVLLRRLQESGTRNQEPEIVAFLALLGISIAALFLHAWEDSAVAYTVWMLLAASRSYCTPGAITKEESSSSSMASAANRMMSSL